MNFLKIIITVAIALSFSFNLEAKPTKQAINHHKKSVRISHETNKKVESLIAKIQSRISKARSQVSDSLFKFYLSPENPKQGEEITFFLQPSSAYTDQESVVTANFENSPLTLTQYGIDLFVGEIPAQTEVKSHTLSAELFLRDKSESKEIRDAILVLEAEIQALNDAIDQETDPVLRDQLIAERDAKIALKAQLIEALENLKQPIGSENFLIQVNLDDQNPSLPKISNLDPEVVNPNVGTNITISGVNLNYQTLTPLVLIGGEEANIESIDQATLVVSTAGFSSLGIKDVELRYTDTNGIITNTILKNALFVTDQELGGGEPEPIPPKAPVAINKALNANLNLGDLAEFSSTGSYDINNDSYTYSWKLIAKPQGSLIDVPTNPPGVDPSFSFTPDVPGTYVTELTLTDNSQNNLVSEPSLAVVYVVGGANNAPLLTAPSINLATNTQDSSQISLTDQDFWQKHSYVITKQGSLGTATVSSTGLVTYSAGNNIGIDEVEITAIDNGDPQERGSVLIPITIVSGNQAPVLDFIYKLQYLDGTPIRTGIGVNSVTDSDGIKSIKVNFGDGTEEFDDNLDGFLFHEYRSPGVYTVTITAEDNLGATTVLSDTIAVVQTDIPHPIFHVDTFSGTTPLTVNFDASTASDSDGITSYRWRFGDGTPELNGNYPTIAHTFTNPGVYNVRFRVRDQYASNGEAFVQVYAGVSAPLEGSKPNAYYIASPSRENILSQSVSFDAGKSFDPNPFGSITNYDWEMGDWAQCPSDGCVYSGLNANHTFSSATNYFVGLQVSGALGALSDRHYQEVFAVNQGIMPKPIVTTTSGIQGVAPFQLQVDGTRSYDFDGTIDDYLWFFNDFSACPSDGCTSTLPTATHTYNDPGVYFVNLQTFDNDGNAPTQYITVTVNPSYQALRKSIDQKLKALDDSDNRERESRKRILTGACARGSGEACYYLGQMFEEDGDTFTKEKLFERACTLGYQPACGTFAR